LSQVTRPGFFAQPLAIEQATKQVEDFQSLFSVADETSQVTTYLLSLLQEFPTAGKQVHDANIIATMLTYQIDTLLTQNIDDMKRFSSKVTLLPLVGDRK
jgi:hypothetical protein